MPTQQSSSSTSPTLLERVSRLDAEAWERLSELYGPLVYRWCRQSGLQDTDASDVSQEVFRAVAGGIAGFQRDRPGDSFRGWLWTITKNKIRDFGRQRAGKPGAIGGTAGQGQMERIPDLPEDADDSSGFDAAASLAHRALQLVKEDFEPHTWQAFLRLTMHGESAGDVAAELGMSVGAVHTAKWRILRRLREEIDGLL